MRFLSITLLAFCISCSEKATTSEIVDLEFLNTVERASLPHLVKGANDKLYLSWIRQSGDTSALLYSVFENSVWSDPSQIAQGTDWFVNWADYPMIAADEKGNLLAHYLAKSATGTYSYNVNIVSKKPTDSVWSSASIPHTDNTPTEHGFVTILPLSKGKFQVAWLDGRNTLGEGHDHHGQMTFRTAVMDVDGAISEEVELDDRTCDCCQTGGALTDNGPVFVYRDRSPLEIRDISIVRKANGQWTAPKVIFTDNWEIDGCPVNGPRVAAHGNQLAVAWYTAPANTPQVKVIFSDDGGETFGAPVIVDNTTPLGRVDIVWLTNKEIMVSWLDLENEKATIKAQKIGIDGSKKQPIAIAVTSEARGSGFPQMEMHSGNVYFAWTDLIGEKEYQVKSTRLKIE